MSDIYETSKVSVALPVHPGSEAIRMFRLVLAEGRSLPRQRNEIEDRAVSLLSELPDHRLLTTIPGVGPINAMPSSPKLVTCAGSAICCPAMVCLQIMRGTASF